MKTVLSVSAFILCLTFPLKSNPVLEWYFNELQVDSSGWRMEIIIYMPTSFDDFYLTSKSGSAYFKTGLVFLPELCVITEDSLMSSLYINPSGDSLCFYDSSHFCLDEMSFGSISTFQYVPAPLPGQSVCLYADPAENEYFWYLDKSPTFGLPNDTANAMGAIEGFVSDTTGAPLGDVEVIYGYYEILGMVYPKSVMTDSLGYFRLRDYAKWSLLKFEKNDLMSVNYSLQNWPDSTVTIYVTMTPLVNIGKTSMEVLPEKIRLLQNYPNPFNSETVIEIYIPHNSFIELSVYNVLGENISTLYEAKISKGSYTFHWDGTNQAGIQLPSGIYFYQLQSEKENITKKMFLLK